MSDPADVVRVHMYCQSRIQIDIIIFTRCNSAWWHHGQRKAQYWLISINAKSSHLKFPWGQATPWPLSWHPPFRRNSSCSSEIPPLVRLVPFQPNNFCQSSNYYCLFRLSHHVGYTSTLSHITLSWFGFTIQMNHLLASRYLKDAIYSHRFASPNNCVHDFRITATVSTPLWLHLQ